MSVALWTGVVVLAFALAIGLVSSALLMRRRRIRRSLVPRYAGNGPETLSGLAFESIVVPQPSLPLGFDATLPPQAIRSYRSSALQLPNGFDVDAFVTSAKRSFMQWRAAFLQGDQTRLRQFTASELFERVLAQLNSRDPSTTQPLPAGDRAGVVALEAELLAIHQEASTPVASVRFKGLLEALGGGRPQAFDEVWNLAQVVEDSRWVVSHVESVQLAT